MSQQVFTWSILTGRLFVFQEQVSLSEGSTVDLRKPGDEMDNFSELDDESMEPEECFPECENYKQYTTEDQTK